MSFKVGDKVFVSRKGIEGWLCESWNGSSGTVTNEAIRGGSVRVRLDNAPNELKGLHERMDGLWCKGDYVKRLCNEPRKNEAQSPCELRCAFVGNATTMSLVDADGKVECTATARCHPNDKWDIGTGMALAFDRLYNKYREQNPNHSAPMVGDSVRLKKDALLPLIINYGSSDTPAKVIYNEVGTVKAVSPNIENVIVEWSHNVVAVVAASDLERGSRELKKPLYRKGDVLITRKNGCPVRVRKDYYSGSGNICFKTARGKYADLPPEKFSGIRTEQNRVKVGDKVRVHLNGFPDTLGIVEAIRPNECENTDWLNLVTVTGVDLNGKMGAFTVGEENVRRLVQRDARVGDKLFVVNEGFSPEHRSGWALWDLTVANGKFCKADGHSLFVGERSLRVTYNNRIAYVDPAYVIVLDE